MDCKHERAMLHADGRPYRCLDCGVRVCAECAVMPAWWFSDEGRLCRADHAKRKSTLLTITVAVDPDDVLRLTHGNEGKAREIIEALVRGEFTQSIQVLARSAPESPRNSRMK